MNITKKMGELEGEDPSGGGAESPRPKLLLSGGATREKTPPEGSPKNSVGKGGDGSSINSYRAR